jgi:hypothetical protein
MIEEIIKDIRECHARLGENPLDASTSYKLINRLRELEKIVEFYGDCWYEGYKAAVTDHQKDIMLETETEIKSASEKAESEFYRRAL